MHPSHPAVCVTLLCLAACAPDTGGDTAAPDDEPVMAKSVAVASASGKVAGTGGKGLNVRLEARSNSAQVTWLPEGKQVAIQCQVEGQTVAGSALWDYLPAHGGYVADAYVNTGHAARIPGIPDCNAGSGECGDLDFSGECDGDTLRWCEDDALQTYDCATVGKSCGWQDDTVGNNCVSGGASSGGGSSGGASGTRLTVTEIVGGASYSISQDYGPSSFYGGYGYCQSYGDWGGVNVHCGTDVSLPYGTPLYIPGDAEIIHAGGTGYFEDETNPAAGELKVRLGDGTEVVLGHMSYIAVGTGQEVEMGAYAGESGTANGGHVHLEVRVPSAAYASGFQTVDPMTFFGW
ncbi:MAG: peptidoglycan DD-metalloendopeptidase family protein [Polyangiaceae bacterium]